MGRSQKWPDLRSPMSKIRDIHFVGSDNLIIFRQFHNFPWNIVAVARLESYFVVGSLDLTWWPDLTWHWDEIFTKVAEKMGSKVGENPAALRAAVFSLASKNLRGAFKRPPPSRARVNPRPDEVWRVTRPDEGVAQRAPLRIFKSKSRRVKNHTALERSRRTLQDTIMLTLFFDLWRHRKVKNGQKRSKCTDLR